MIELAIAFLCGIAIGVGIGIVGMCMAQISAKAEQRRMPSNGVRA